MEFLQKLALSFGYHLDQQSYLPFLLIIDAGIITFTYSFLGKISKFVLLFVTGFIILGGFLGSIMTAYLFQGMPAMKAYLIGGLIGGVMLLGLKMVSKAAFALITFLVGAVLPILVMMYLGILKFSTDVNIKMVVIALIAAFAGGVLLNLLMRKVSETTVCRVVGSAVTGAVCIGLLLMWTDGFKHMGDLYTADAVMNLLKKIENREYGLLIIILAASGGIVQTLMHFRSKRKSKPKAQPPKEAAVTEAQVLETEQPSSGE